MSDDPKHNPGEPEFGDGHGGKHNPGEPEFGSQAEHDHDGEPADADEAAEIAEGHS
jgi:hypothetical protein